MYDIKNAAEFKKCGELLVAAKKNKLAMSCNFCKEMFSQLPSFMRHLKKQHDNQLAVHKQAKEVEVYAVEELISQYVVSSVLDIENDESNTSEEDAKWLREADMKWLDEGVDVNVNQQLDKNLNMLNGEDEEEGLSLTNMSILKALEDCDVSLNLMQNINNTKCSVSETESHLDNSLLPEIQINDWDNTMEEILLNTSTKENLNQTKLTYEKSPTKCITNLLQGLENVDDVDSLLENLESTTTNKYNNVVTENTFKGFCNPQNNLIENQKFNVVKHSGRNNCLLNTKSKGKILNYEQNLNKEGIKSTTVVLEMNSKVQSNGLEDFQIRLKEMTNVLQEDVADTRNIAIKTTKYERIPGIYQNSKQGGLALQLKDIEGSPDNRNYVSYNLIIDNSSKSEHDLEIKLKNLEGSLNDSVILEENNAASESNISFNKDLTKALADALEEKDLDFFNIQQEAAEEPPSDDLLNLLERELIENEKKQELPLLKDQHTLDTKIQPNEKIFKKERKSESCHESNVISKYQKTNLKAKTKIPDTRHKNSIKPEKCLVPTEFNSINSISIVQDFQKPLKGNHDILFNQKQLTSITNSHNFPLKTPTGKNAMGKMLENFGQIKISVENKENNSIDLNIQNIKKETSTPIYNFVNMHRGDKTPIKRDQIFLKQSPKSQEKLESLVKNLTPKRDNNTPQKIKIKQSPKTQEKQQNFNQQLTLQEALQKISQLQTKDKLKQSPKEISNTIKKSEQTPEVENIIIKEQKDKSPAKCLIRANEKPLYNYAKTSLTTSDKLRNVAIKLQSYTYDQLTQQPKTKDGKKQIIHGFKLPGGISVTILPKQSSISDANQCEITPIKTTVYCKQNFSEASLESSEQYELIKASSSLIQAQRQTNNNLKTKATFAKVRQRKASIDILPSTRNVKQTAQISAHKTSSNSNLDYNSCTINRSARKKEVLQRMHKIKKQIFKSIEERECRNRFNDAKSQSIKRQKKEILVENIQILPNLNNTTITPLIFNDLKKPFENNSTPTTNSESPKNLADDQKQAILAVGRSQNVATVNDDEKLIRKSLKRRASAPLNNWQAKRQHKSPAKEQVKVEGNTSDLEGTQLDLSESVVDFLQRDLKSNRLNVESLLNEDLPLNDSTPNENSAESNTKETKIEETSNEKGLNYNNILIDLLEQVENEQNTKEKRKPEHAENKGEILDNSTTFKDFDDARDIDLLEKLGLKIIKLPEIEDVITLEERDAMSEKAIKFAGIYRKWPRVWSTKNSSCPTTKEEMDASFKQLLTETNQSFHLALSIVEIKRLTNLINIWYARIFNNKFIEKRKISDSVNRYLRIFFYVPRTIKRYYFCEYCPEYFNTEHRYFTHRIAHTGASFPYTCQKCSIGYKTVKQLNNHEFLCKEILSDKTYQSDKKLMVTFPKTYQKSTTRNKCFECAETFATCEQLNEHTKKHLKYSFSCAKCKIVFATVMDVQNHMTKCNIETKNMPKLHTPRPPRQK